MKNIIFAITALFLSSTFAYAGRFAEDSSLSSGIQSEDSHDGAHKDKKYARDGDRKRHEGKRHAWDGDRKRHEGRKYALDDDRNHGGGEYDSHDRDHEVSPH